jgi:hypothetical protein
MFDFRCWIIPRFVYAVKSDFAVADGLSAEIRARVEQLVRTAVGLAGALESMKAAVH